MRASSMCISCLLSKQERMIRNFKDENKKSEYMHELLGLLYQYSGEESAPALAERINKLYESFWGMGENYAAAKHQYNQLLLSKETEILALIESAEDSVKEAIKYAAAGNYIDFSAVENVNEKTFQQLLQKAASETISEEEYTNFQEDLKQAKRLVYLTDNCGEILLDKLLLHCLKKTYPGLQIMAVVRGENVINDATMDDAEEVGLTDMVICIGNGNGAPGTVLKRLSREARQALAEADVIISKGQGNFESLLGEGLNPYYLFLCKCELFVRRFGLQQYQSVFVREERMKVDV